MTRTAAPAAWVVEQKRVKVVERDLVLKHIGVVLSAWYGVGPKLSRDDVQDILKRLKARLEALETWEAELP